MASRTRKPNNSPQSSAGSVTKRLQIELTQLMMSGHQDITAFPEGDNLLKWSASIKGVQDTPYEGLTFKLTIEFPPNYPFKAPVVTFDSPVYHPNVDTNGGICLDILKDKWSAVLNVTTILLSLQSLLGEPNNESPLNPQAAELWHNKVEFRKMVLAKCQSSAPKSPTIH